MQDHPLFDAELSELEIAVFDLETTGLFPAQDRIIQIALVKVSGLELGEEYESKVNPGQSHLPLEQLIIDLTGITNEQVEAAREIDEVLPEFGGLVGQRIVAGHNVASFDLPFIRRAEQRADIDVQSDFFVDTLRLAFRLKEQERYRLADCARAYDLEFDEDALHDALEDTRLCARLLNAQIEDLASRDVNTFGEMIRFLS